MRISDMLAGVKINEKLSSKMSSNSPSSSSSSSDDDDIVIKRLPIGVLFIIEL